MLNFNTAPYFDDFDPNNKFYRILYRPAFAVQGRELTQSQSMIQEQIKKFGDHIFQEGAMVIPGQITFDKEVSYQKMVATYGNPPNDIDVDPANFLGYTIIGEYSGVEGEIVNISAKNSTDPLTFFIKFKDSGDNNTSIGFWDGETIYRKDDTQIRATVEGTLDTLNPTFDSTGKGSVASIEKGVYYVGGIFVDNDAQSIIVSKYDQTPTVKVGLRVYESIITPEDDFSLNDNAQGSPNYAAPGAHRYKIELKLEYVNYDEDISDDFIILQYLRTGEVVKEIRTTSYSELEKTFARRTFDESGDYTVNPFSIIVKEHLRDENIDQYKEGVYFAPVGDESKLVAEMGSGKAYVQGYEINNISKSNVELDKSRDYDISNNSITNFSLGNYIIVDNLHNNPRIDEFGDIELYDAVSTPGTQGSGNLVGTAKVRAIKRYGTESYLYIFDINMSAGYNFDNTVKWIYDTNGIGSNNFTCSTVLDVDGNTHLYKVNDNVLLFELPHNTIKTLSVGGAGIDTGYSSIRGYFNVGIVSNTATLVAKDDEVFQQNTSEYYIADTGTGVQYDVSTLTFNFTGSPIGKVIEIGNLTGTVNILAPISKSISTQKTKYLQTNGSIIISYPNKIQNDKDLLQKADIYKLKNVYMSQDFTTVPTSADVDITNRYTLDNGQKNNYYDIGSIILRGGEPEPTGQILVEFDYFTHTDGDYFSVDSYVDIDFDNSQIYTSKETGETYNLFDCFDFRPRMSDDGSGFTGVGGSIGELPQVFSDIRSDYEYYLNRIDYLYLDYTGSFMIAKGIPAVHPAPPEKPEMGMILYELYIPAYTFKPSHLDPTYKDNKRYTMRDIGDLDKRIGNLEYYTSLSLLERETASMEILDSNGLNRFKNGFIVDPFDSHNVGDSTHTDYKCAIDPNEKLMRPKFNDENIGLLFDSTNSVNVKRTGGIVSLPYTELGINAQKQASKYENINPFAFRNIFGTVTFNPDSDVWHDKKKLPTLVVNNSPNYKALKHIADNTGDLSGVEWGRWKDVGGRKNIKTVRKTISSREYKDANWTPEHHSFRSLKINSKTTITKSWQQNQEISGVARTNKDSNVISKSLGDRITEINYIPYMRSIPVLIKTEQMKKKTKVYPFFDNVSMSKDCVPPAKKDYCTPASTINCTSITGTFLTNNYNEEFITSTSGSTAIIVFQGDTYVNIVNINGTFLPGETFTGNKSGASGIIDNVIVRNLGDSLITGKFGELALVWQIPNNNDLKFMTGEREFVLNDQISNADPVHTKAKGMFKSHGMSSKQEDTVLSTKTIKFIKKKVKHNRILNRKNTRTETTTTGWIDPLAQSFLITESGGCFLTKVRLWFQNKDEEESVVCQIRNMVNGYPAEIAMAETTLTPNNVNISEKQPGSYTDFIFHEPIYLKEDEDYCFVLMPSISSASYNVWVAENGRIDISTGDIITGKESLGSLFKSQNASTWTPNQNEDIMFELFKAKFDISSSGTCQLVNAEIDADLLDKNPLETQNGSSRVRVYHPNHGLTENSIYYISGLDDVTNYNGFIGSQLNGEVTVTDTEIDTFTFDVSGTQATSTGLTGGDGVYGTRNYQLDRANPIINELLLDGTNIDWQIQTTTGTSVNGTQTPYIQKPFIDIINKDDLDMTEPMLIGSKYNEDAHLNGNKSLKLIGTMVSDNENVSPIVDASLYDSTTNTGNDAYFNQSSSNLIAIANKIDFPSYVNMNVGTDVIFSIGAGENEFVILHPDHELGTGSFIQIENFTDTVDLVVGTFDPNGLNEIRVIDKDKYLINIDGTASTGYSGDGGGGVILSYSLSHIVYIPETKSFNCSTGARYLTKQVTLIDPAENFKLYFSAVRQQDADIDVYYKTRSPYEVTEWNKIDWIVLNNPDDDIPLSQSNDDFKDYSYTVENIDPYNTISVKLVMKSTNSTQVPIFSDFRLICTT